MHVRGGVVHEMGHEAREGVAVLHIPRPRGLEERASHAVGGELHGEVARELPGVAALHVRGGGVH
eukprot:5631132-Alexandrium_andersonii.AAC.1